MRNPSESTSSTQELLDYFYSRHDTLWYKITTPFYRARNFLRYKWWNFRERCQRFKRGYSWKDARHMDAWFISTTKPMLEHLLKTHHGYPGIISNKEWEETIREMVDCLSLMDEDKASGYLNIADNDFSPESYKRVSELMDTKKNRFFELFSKWFFHLVD